MMRIHYCFCLNSDQPSQLNPQHLTQFGFLDFSQILELECYPCSTSSLPIDHSDCSSWRSSVVPNPDFQSFQ
ncbi:hypothetical protein Hdeb2414_s0019g00544501 [Helianthus debilis subsp. tardiflorus]